MNDTAAAAKLADLEARQDRLLEELRDLNHRIESALRELTPTQEAPIETPAGWIGQDVAVSS